eukprot:403341010
MKLPNLQGLLNDNIEQKLKEINQRDKSKSQNSKNLKKFELNNKRKIPNIKYADDSDDQVSVLSTIYEEVCENEEFEGVMSDPLFQVIPQHENSVAVFFNIASLFRNSHFTVTPEQFGDNAKHSHRWSNIDDNKLLKAFQKYENNWTKIQMEMRLAKADAEDIKDRYKRLTEATVKGTWTQEEDSIIMREYKKLGRNWGLIAKKVPGRSGKQIRERYVNYLEKKDNIKKEQFSEEEDDLIMKYFDIYPHDWNKISENVKTKSASQIKKRFVNFLREKKLESSSTMSTENSSVNNIQIDNVSEINNSVDSLIDPIGDFFRQRLSLMKSSTMTQIQDFDQENQEGGTNQWLLKKSSLEENKQVLNMFENQGMLGIEQSNTCESPQKNNYLQINSFGTFNRSVSGLSSNIDDEQSQQDPEYQNMQFNYNTQGSINSPSQQQHSRKSQLLQPGNNFLVPSLFKSQKTQMNNSSFKKSYSSNKQMTKYNKNESPSALRLNSQNLSVRSKITNNTNTPRENSSTFSQGDESEFQGGSGQGLFDFDYLLMSDSSVNNDRSDCGSNFETSMVFQPSPRGSFGGFDIQVTTLQS